MFDRPRTVSRDGTSAAIPWPSLLDLIYLASMSRDRLVHPIALDSRSRPDSRTSPIWWGQHARALLSICSASRGTNGLFARWDCPELVGGCDGAKGLAAIRAAGGITVVQHPSAAKVSAPRAGDVDPKR